MQVLLMLLFLSGCAATRADLDAAANVGGCLCAATECKSLVAASGQAAISAEAQARRLQVEKRQ